MERHIQRANNQTGLDTVSKTNIRYQPAEKGGEGWTDLENNHCSKESPFAIVNSHNVAAEEFGLRQYVGAEKRAGISETNWGDLHEKKKKNNNNKNYTDEGS